MDQLKLELQLKVWKDLAISNQILMRAATDALDLNPECSTDELRTALHESIKRSREADVMVEKVQEKSRHAIADMQKRIATSEKAQAAIEAAKEKVLAAKKLSEQQMAVERANHANEIKNIKLQLAEKDKALKAINKALADTPENVMKKLRALKKQKSDEATARKQAETNERSLREEKKKLLESAKTSEAKITTLAEQYRELHKLCETLHEQLKPLVDDEKNLPSLPVLDEALLGGSDETPKAKKK